MVALAVVVVFEGVFVMLESPDAIGAVAAGAQVDQAKARKPTVAAMTAAMRVCRERPAHA